MKYLRDISYVFVIGKKAVSFHFDEKCRKAKIMTSIVFSQWVVKNYTVHPSSKQDASKRFIQKIYPA